MLVGHIEVKSLKLSRCVIGAVCIGCFLWGDRIKQKLTIVELVAFVGQVWIVCLFF